MNGLMFGNVSAGFNGPATNGVSGAILFGQGTTATPIWGNSASLPPVAQITQNYFSGYFGSSSTWWANSTGYTTFQNIGGNVLSLLAVSTGFSVAAMGNSAFGIVITPSSASAVYRISLNTTFYCTQTGGSAAFRMTDGITAFAFASMNQATTAADVFAPATVDGIYAGNTTGPIQLFMQGAVSSGTVICGTTGMNIPVQLPSAVWTIFQIK